MKKRNKDLHTKTNDTSSTPLIGVFFEEESYQSKKRIKGFLVSCHRKKGYPDVPVIIAPPLKDKEVVVYEVNPKGDIHVIKHLGFMDDPNVYSKIAAHHHGVWNDFSDELLNEKIQPLSMDHREDLRHIPFVTIDGETAKDFDDAVWSEPISANDPTKGWHIMVAIADVSFYVREGSLLNQEAYHRGNSVYFANCVIPMLPEILSNDLCSLRPLEDRPVLVADMIISQDGKMISHSFKRAMIHSKARLTYTEVQEAIEGRFNSKTEPLWENVLKHLKGTYDSFSRARKKRNTLNIKSSEKEIILGDNGFVKNVRPRVQMDAHHLIEEFMIAANIAAARTLGQKEWPCVYRVHDQPEIIRIENMVESLSLLGINVPPKRPILPEDFNRILKIAETRPDSLMINTLVLRCQMQAQYSPHNVGHYGLQLAEYGHFTSPIRRYADLVVHRLLIAALKLGEGGTHAKPTLGDLETIGQHISQTERKAMMAERETQERYLVSMMLHQVGQVMSGVITGVIEAGFFVSLNESGAEGFVPIYSLRNRYQFNHSMHAFLSGKKPVYRLGDTIEVQLVHADLLMNSLTLKPYEAMSSKRKDTNQTTSSFKKFNGPKPKRESFHESRPPLNQSDSSTTVIIPHDDAMKKKKKRKPKKAN
jgi:ribonuclease R